MPVFILELLESTAETVPALRCQMKRLHQSSTASSFVNKPKSEACVRSTILTLYTTIEHLTIITNQGLQIDSVETAGDKAREARVMTLVMTPRSLGLGRLRNASSPPPLPA